jgi:AraC family transcriptional regulator, regulatory protein of adaptative response / methylated-DNA-[protein]-cysteine methyltransferase
MEIKYSTLDSPVGRMLVAVSPQGLRAVALGDDDDALLRDLFAMCPGCEIRRDDVGPWAGAVLGVLHGHPVPPDLPLAPAGTPFQRDVWDALRRIPPGSTATYGQIAAAIGRPGAARAVGAACGANPLALVVPCHRAVPAGGGLGGYRWGVERKSRLLEMERQSVGGKTP